MGTAGSLIIRTPTDRGLGTAGAGAVVLRAWLLALAVALLGTPAMAAKRPKPKVPEKPAAAGAIVPDPTQLSLEQRFELNRQARVRLARVCAKDKDILGWGQALFPDKFALPFCDELHGYFVSIRGEAFTDTEAPRGHAKTTIKCFLIPLFQALEEPETFQHYLNVQATAEKAVDINRAIKLELEQNQELREIYGDQISPEKWTEKQFVLKNGVIFTAIGANQSIRGINYRARRPDYIVVDDLYDEEEINNLEATLKRNRWFWGSLYKARAIGRRTSIHVQGTAVNGSDLMEELKKNKGVVAKTFQAVTDWDKKLVLWREANTFEQLEQDRSFMGTVIFMREMQNERRDDASAIVKAAWLENWEYDPDLLTFSEELQLVGVLLGVDPSIGANTKTTGTKKQSDYTGVVLVYEGRPREAAEDGGNFYIDGLWNEHLSFDRRLGLLRSIKEEQISRGRPVTRASIEGIAGFKDFVAKARQTGLPVREHDKVPDKLTHLENKSHFFENGRVRVSKRISKELRDKLFYQLTTNHPTNDDLRDGLLLVLPSQKRQAWRPV